MTYAALHSLKGDAIGALPMRIPGEIGSPPEFCVMTLREENAAQNILGLPVTQKHAELLLRSPAA